MLDWAHAGARADDLLRDQQSRSNIQRDLNYDDMQAGYDKTRIAAL